MSILFYNDSHLFVYIVVAEKNLDEDEEEEEIIRCICNIYRDEGLMIQCEKCEVSMFMCLLSFFVTIILLHVTDIKIKDSY